MNWKVRSVVVLTAIGLLVGGLVIWKRSHSRPPIQAVVLLYVQPADQLDLVMTKANSARFKYLLCKISGTRPYLAQQLQLKRLPESAGIEARIGLGNREEAKKYIEAF